MHKIEKCFNHIITLLPTQAFIEFVSVFMSFFVIHVLLLKEFKVHVSFKIADKYGTYAEDIWFVIDTLTQVCAPNKVKNEQTTSTMFHYIYIISLSLNSM